MFSSQSQLKERPRRSLIPMVLSFGQARSRLKDLIDHALDGGLAVVTRWRRPAVKLVPLSEAEIEELEGLKPKISRK